MGVQTATQAQGMGRMLPTRPTEIRAMLEATADPGVVEQFDLEWDDAMQRCRDHDTAEPIFGFLRRWGFEALNWQDPDKHRAFLAHLDELAQGGPPPAAQRSTREQVRQAWEEHHGRPFND